MQILEHQLRIAARPVPLPLPPPLPSLLGSQGSLQETRKLARGQVLWVQQPDQVRRGVLRALLCCLVLVLALALQRADLLVQHKRCTTCYVDAVSLAQEASTWRCTLTPMIARLQHILLHTSAPKRDYLTCLSSQGEAHLVRSRCCQR